MEEPPEYINEVIESDPLRRYGLKLVGIGAENACFETIGSKKKFIKVAIDNLKRKIIGLVHSPEEKSKRHSFVDEHEEKRTTESKEQERELVSVFGPEHILKKNFLPFNVPLTKEMILKILADSPDDAKLAEELEDKVYEVETIIQTQKIAEELREPESYDMMDYSTPLLTHDHFLQSEDVQNALEKIRKLVDRELMEPEERLLADKKYSKIVREVTEKIIQYTKKTGLMVDIFGPNNITIFTNKEGKPDYHLIDAILPGLKVGWTVNIKDEKDSERLFRLRHYYTYYYSLKKISEVLGIENGIDLQD